MLNINWKKVIPNSILDVFYYHTDPNRPVMGVIGEVTLIDSNGNIISSFGGGGSSGNDGWTTASGQISAVANIGTKTITLSGLSFTLTAEMVSGGSIQKIDSSGNVTSVPITTVTVSGDIITLAGADDFVSGDVVSVTLKAIDKAYDVNQDVNKVNIENPEWDHYNSIEHIVDIVDAPINTYFISIATESYRNMAIQLSATDATGFEFKIYATLDEDATVPATGGTAGTTWIEITSDISGGTITGVSIAELAFIDTSLLPDRYLLEYTNQNATNTVDVWIRKY